MERMISPISSSIGHQFSRFGLETKTKSGSRLMLLIISFSALVCFVTDHEIFPVTNKAFGKCMSGFRRRKVFGFRGSSISVLELVTYNLMKVFSRSYVVMYDSFHF